MLQLVIPATEKWDEIKEEFVYTKEYTLHLEHSLVSISKWESKYHKPFLSNKEMTTKESIDYIKCMTITQNIPPEAYDNITNDNIQKVSDYMNDPMTATWFSEDKTNKKSSREIVTSELIYYWMITLNIPMEWEKRHFNRLLTLIQVCNIKNQKPKKMSKKELANRNHALNAARRKQLHSKG